MTVSPPPREFCGVSPCGGLEMRPVPGRGGVPGKPGSLRLRRGAKPPFSFSTEKEKAPFDGVKRKDAGGGIPDFVRNARGACYGGLDWWKSVGFCPLNRIWQSKKLGVFPDTLSFSFAAAIWWVSKERCQGLCECQGAAAKQEQGASGTTPN